MLVFIFFQIPNLKHSTLLAFDLYLPGFTSFVVFVDYAFTLCYLVYATVLNENKLTPLSHGWI